MSEVSIPVTILGGSDLRPGQLPPEGAGQHPLAAYKGVAVQVAGRPIVAWLVERLAECPELGPVAIAGPRRVYEGLGLPVSIVDTDGTVAENVRAAIDAFLEQNAEGPMALLACDVLPEPEELRTLLDEYAREAPRDVWFPLVRAPLDPAEIGAFGWKPAYRIAPMPDAEPVRVLPGHLLVADPRAMRLPLLYRLIDVAYRTRNRGVGTRQSAMLRAVLLELLLQDVRHLLGLRLPNLTWTVVRNGLGVARRLREDSLTRERLERAIGRILLKARHRRRHPERGVGLPVVDTLGLAEDVDTEEEARQVARRVESEG